MMCQGSGYLESDIYRTCGGEVDQHLSPNATRLVLFNGWAIRVVLCPAHAELWDLDVKAREMRVAPT
jgi:hypothetical protein